MYISPYIVQTLHEDRIRDAQRYAHTRIGGGQPSVSLFTRISELLHVRTQHQIRDARHAHAI